MNIIINGGTRGIGKEIVYKMAQDIKNQLLVTGRNEIALNNLSARFKNVTILPFDLSDSDMHLESLRKTVYGLFNKVDILINVAGLLVVKEFMKTEKSESRDMMETNFFGPAAVISEVKPLMSNGAHIVNITSMGGFQGSLKYSGLSYYSASKAALACLSECLAIEFMESGISVNCLALGSVQTEMFEEAFPGYKAQVNAKEMAEFISDFAINGNRFINGKIIPVSINNP